MVLIINRIRVIFCTKLNQFPFGKLTHHYHATRTIIKECSGTIKSLQHLTHVINDVNTLNMETLRDLMDHLSCHSKKTASHEQVMILNPDSYSGGEHAQSKSGGFIFGQLKD